MSLYPSHLPFSRIRNPQAKRDYKHHRDAENLDMQKEAANSRALGQTGHIMSRSLLHGEYPHFAVFCCYCSIEAT